MRKNETDITVLENKLKNVVLLNKQLEERVEEIEEANYKIADLASDLEEKLDFIIKEKELLTKEISGDISRFIEFEEQNYEYGLSILSHFGKIVENKFPDKNVRVRIEQNKSTIKMIIHSGNEHLETIEKALEEYGMVVSGQLKPDEFLSDKFEAMLLRHKLDSAIVQLTQTKEVYALLEKSNNKRVEFLESQVSNLNNLIANGLTVIQNDKEIIKLFISKQNDLNPEIIYLLNNLADMINENNMEKTNEILSKIKQANPSVFEKIENFLYGSLANTTGSLLFSLIASIK